MPGHTASGGRGFPVTTFRVSPLEHLKPLLNLKKKNQKLFVSCFLKCQKNTKETTATSSIGPHEITLSKSRNRDKELVSVKRKTERKRKGEKGGKEEGKRGGQYEWPDPFLALIKGRKRNRLGPHCPACTQDEEALICVTESLPQYFFS